MDKKEAIELLKRYLTEIPELRNRPNEEAYERWVYRVTIVIKAGLEQEDLNTFISDNYVIPFSFPSSNSRRGYVEPQPTYYKERITVKEIALKKVIDKYEILGIEVQPIPKAKLPPKAFIVHGGKSGVLDKLREFVEVLGIKPLIVEMLPSKGMPLVDKVKKYQQEADCAIILATRGGIIDIKSGKQHPRLNVIDELSSFWEAFPEKVILLLEKGVELPSNKAGLTYEPFARQSMDRAFIAIARELTEMKILKAVKPPEEQKT